MGVTNMPPLKAGPDAIAPSWERAVGLNIDENKMPITKRWLLTINVTYS